MDENINIVFNWDLTSGFYWKYHKRFNTEALREGEPLAQKKESTEKMIEAIMKDLTQRRGERLSHSREKQRARRKYD